MDDKRSGLRLISGGAIARPETSSPTGSLIRVVTDAARRSNIREEPVQLSLFPDVSHDGPALLGVFVLPETFERALRVLLERIRPAWLVDLRALTWFAHGSWNRKRAFELFRENQVAYCDGSVAFDITSHRDPRIATGEIAHLFCQHVVKRKRPLVGPLVFLVDNTDLVAPIIEAFPSRIKPAPTGGWRTHVLRQDALLAP